MFFFSSLTKSRYFSNLSLTRPFSYSLSLILTWFLSPTRSHSLSLSLIHYCSLPPSLFLATFSLTDSPSLSFTFTIYALTISPFLCKAVEIISSTLIMMGHIVIFFFHDFLSSLGKFRYFHSPSHSLNLSLTHSLSLTLLSLSFSLSFFETIRSNNEGYNCYFHFHDFISFSYFSNPSLTCSLFLSFSLLLSALLYHSLTHTHFWFAGTQKSTLKQISFSWTWLGNLFRFLSFKVFDNTLCIYHWLVWPNLAQLHDSQ